MKKIFLFLIVLCVSLPVLAEDIRYIHGKSAKLFSEASFKADVIENIERGRAVNVIEEQKRWDKVQHNNHEGWVSKLQVKKKPPAQKASLLEKNEQDLSGTARRRASASAPTAAARGLRQDGDNTMDENAQSDFEALNKMENAKVSDQEALEFIEQELN